MDMALGKCIGLVCRGAMNTPKTAFAIALVFIGTYLYGHPSMWWPVGSNQSWQGLEPGGAKRLRK